MHSRGWWQNWDGTLHFVRCTTWYLIVTMLVLVYLKFVYWFYRSESSKILHASIIRAINASYFTFVVPVVMFMVFTFNYFFGSELTTAAVFSTLSHLYFLNITLIVFVKAVLDLSDCRVGLKRISVSEVHTSKTVSAGKFYWLLEWILLHYVNWGLVWW